MCLTSGTYPRNSFPQGEKFVVRNELGDGWLWVTSERTGQSGIVYTGFVEDLDKIDPVEVLDFYHSNITKAQASNKLYSSGLGSFLVRPSDSNPGDYSLYCLPGNKPKKFRIEKRGRQFMMGGRYFNSINDIVERYKKEEILDGFTLQYPVLKDCYDIQNADLCDFNGREIYASFRQSSGPNFLASRNDTIVMRGYLNKRSEKTKKWKNFYFMLNKTDQQLYFFESVKRSRPKGLIDLSYTSMYPVHDSFFERPNCFQLLMRGLNHVSQYYLFADNADFANDWIQALKPFCVNTVIKNKPASSKLKELRSLNIEILEIHRLPKSAPHPYCIIMLNDIKVCRTSIKDGLDPVFEEEFVIEEIPPDIDSFTITVYNKNRRSKDTEIVQVTQILENLPEGETIDEWFNLSSVVPTIRVDGATIRLRCRYLHEIIMPLSEYSALTELLMDKDFDMVFALDALLPSCGHDRIPLAKALLRVFRYHGQEALLMKTLNDLEIHREETAPGLFRGTSLATTLMTEYMKMTASDFVKSTLTNTINRIHESKQVCELNPGSLENPADASANTEYLLSLLNEIVEYIFLSAEKCPKVLRYICGCLQESAQAKWPNDENVRSRVVSGFIFLRLICPAILNPKMFNILTETPSEVAVRTLKLVAKSLLNLGNLVDCGKVHDSTMQAVLPFIKNNKDKMIKFIDDLSNIKESPQNEPQNCLIERDLATVHRICVSQIEQLNNMSQTRPNLKRLITVTDILTDHKKRYMGGKT
ncbi:ras GTPase-activating protein 1-like isoform X2 [Tubulanus polymorphus]|uniref:ras GTPase-activating protein 1-like isoform X2 n=1 Tax=Tubulanus polymorphus TaxID=672921 RepID=UPI003DA28834